MSSDSNLLKIQQPIQPNATSVDVKCLHCACTEEHQAPAWYSELKKLRMQINKHCRE